VRTRPRLLDCIERYFAAAPLLDGPVAAVGPLDVPVGTPAWPHPARPRPGAGPVGVEDVRAAAVVQRRAGLPVALEWVVESCPSAAAAAGAAGLVVAELPLLVAADPVELLPPPGVRLYVVGAEDPQLPRYQAVARLAFAAPGEGPGPVPPVLTEVLRERIAAGRTVMMVAVEDGEPVGVGSHQPLEVHGHELSEVVGLATLPRLRGRGLGAGLASALTAHARESAELVFLTAGDDDVARVYERVGFARAGTTGVADELDGGAAGGAADEPGEPAGRVR
jgi:GNAT superfamily N-acetyltransferase